MALVFEQKQVATIKGKSTDSTDTYTIPGVTNGTTTVENAATQINKILGIVGRQIAADEYMTRTTIEEAVDDG